MRRREGFALIELIMALTIAGMVLLTARSLLVQATDSAARTVALVANDTREAATERFLRWSLLRLDTAGAVMTGDSQTVVYQSLCDTAHGWAERCMVQLVFLMADEVERLAVTMHTPTRSWSVESQLQGRAFAYLVSADHGGLWIDEWPFQVTLPLAIGIVQERDTLILRIGLGR